jgi:hypothetical protein
MGKCSEKVILKIIQRPIEGKTCLMQVSLGFVQITA